MPSVYTRIPNNNELVAPSYVFLSVPLESRIYVKLHFIGHISAATHSVAAEIYWAHFWLHKNLIKINAY